MNIKFKVLEALYDDDYEDLEMDIKLVELGEQLDEGKFTRQEMIFELDGKTYRYWVMIGGSYTEDYSFPWDYQGGQTSDECHEVEQIEVVKKVWRRVR